MSESKVLTRLHGALWFFPCPPGAHPSGAEKGHHQLPLQYVNLALPPQLQFSEDKVQSYGNLKESTPNCAPGLDGATWGASHVSHRYRIINSVRLSAMGCAKHFAWMSSCHFRQVSGSWLLLLSPFCRRGD